MCDVTLDVGKYPSTASGTSMSRSRFTDREYLLLIEIKLERIGILSPSIVVKVQEFS
jgi:hypothetical protein